MLSLSLSTNLKTKSSQRLTLTRGEFCRTSLLNGFTLIELLIVIAIIGILSSVVLVSTNVVKDKANLSKVLSWSSSLNHLMSADAAAIYTFDDGTAKDLSGNGNDCVIHGGVTSVDGIPQLGKALQFDGSTGYLDCGSGASLNITSAITVSAWVKPTVLGSIMDIVTKSYQTSYRGYEFQIDSSKRLSFRINPTSSSYTYKYSTSLLSASVWQHVVAVYDLTNVSFYINGAADTPIAASGAFYSDTSSLKIGSYASSATYFFNGLIDEVRIYNQAYTLSQIQKDYAEGLPRHQVAEK